MFLKHLFLQNTVTRSVFSTADNGAGQSQHSSVVVATRAVFPAPMCSPPCPLSERFVQNPIPPQSIISLSLIKIIIPKK